MARYLDVKKGETQPSVTQADVDNKMREGTRDDQRPRRRTPNAVIRLAADLGVDLAHVDGTGEDNQITEDDVREAADDPTKRVPEAAQLTEARPRRAASPAAQPAGRTQANPNAPPAPNTPNTPPKPTT
jgi:pyruvate/2-oxoglutarate dehydrogenase complex dihydrolipoamide acyltransferase (E2) component